MTTCLTLFCFGQFFSRCFTPYHPAPLATALRAFALHFLADLECSLRAERMLTLEVCAGAVSPVTVTHGRAQIAELFQTVDRVGRLMAGQLACEAVRAAASALSPLALTSPCLEHAGRACSAGAPAARVACSTCAHHPWPSRMKADTVCHRRRCWQAARTLRCRWRRGRLSRAEKGTDDQCRGHPPDCGLTHNAGTRLR
jgi:hypothetical protein